MALAGPPCFVPAFTLESFSPRFAAFDMQSISSISHKHDPTQRDRDRCRCWFQLLHGGVSHSRPVAHVRGPFPVYKFVVYPHAPIDTEPLACRWLRCSWGLAYWC
jgi:hypothetical protein